MKSLALLVAAATALTPTGDARANGRFPGAQHVLVRRGASGTRQIALRTTFGFLLSDDDGQRWRWVCEEAFGYQGAPFDPAFVFSSEGGLVVGLSDGVRRLGADRCTVQSSAALEGRYVVDLDADGDYRRIIAITGDGSCVANRVTVSTNGGESFAPVGAGRTGALFSTLEMAPSNPQRVYLTAVRYTGAPGEPECTVDVEGRRREVFFYRSSDGGATIDELPLAPGLALDSAHIAAVDRSNPDVVYVRALLQLDRSDAGASDAGDTRLDAPTVLLRTENGGASFREVARSRGLMEGFAVSDDGRTVWFGGPHREDGLFRSTDGGATFRQIGRQRIAGLRFFDGALYVTANAAMDGFALGRSTDGGETITALLPDFCAVPGAFDCPGSSLEGTVCAARWPLFRSTRLMCPSTPVFDAGAVDATLDERPATAPSCHCAVRTGRRTRRDARNGAIAALAASLAVARLRRARRRRA